MDKEQMVNKDTGYKEYIIDEFTIDCLKRLIVHVARDEEKDWENEGQPQNHIFHDIDYVQDWLSQNVKEDEERIEE